MACSGYFVLQELNAVHHFVEVFQKRATPVKLQDIHHLLAHNLPVRNFLNSRWKLNRLKEFFRKYKSYFIVYVDGSIYLRKSALNIEELNCVSIFVSLFMERQNYPIPIHSAIGFVSTDVTPFFKTSYDVHDLYSFFRNHNDFFLIDGGLVSLRDYKIQVAVESQDREGRADSPLIQSTPQKARLPFSLCSHSSDEAPDDSSQEEEYMPRAEKRKKKKYKKRMDKKAVEFYRRLLEKDDEISLKEACSYAQGNEELFDYLRNNYHMDDLEPFFEKHTELFLVENEYVRLVTEESVHSHSIPFKVEVKRAPLALRRQMKKKYMEKMDERAVDFYFDLLQERKEINMRDAHSFIHNDVELSDFLGNEYQLGDLEPFFEKHPDLFSFAGQSVRLIPVTSQSSACSPLPRTPTDKISDSFANKQTTSVKAETDGPLPQNGHTAPVSMLAQDSNIQSFTVKQNVTAEPEILHSTSAKNSSDSSNLQSTLEKVKENDVPATPSKQKKRRSNKIRMEEKAVEFYLKLLEKRGQVSVKQAHSFIQDDVELRDHLKNRYQLSNLTPFFENHAELFSVVDEAVRLVSPPVKPKTDSPLLEMAPVQVNGDFVLPKTATPKAKAKVDSPLPEMVPAKKKDASLLPVLAPAKKKDDLRIPQNVPAKTKTDSPLPQSVPAKTKDVSPLPVVSPAKMKPDSPVPQSVPAKKNDVLRIPHTVPAKTNSESPLPQSVPAKKKAVIRIPETEPAKSNAGSPLPQSLPAKTKDVSVLSQTASAKVKDDFSLPRTAPAKSKADATFSGTDPEKVVPDPLSLLKMIAKALYPELSHVQRQLDAERDLLFPSKREPLAQAAKSVPGPMNTPDHLGATQQNYTDISAVASENSYSYLANEPTDNRSELDESGCFTCDDLAKLSNYILFLEAQRQVEWESSSVSSCLTCYGDFQDASCQTSIATTLTPDSVENGTSFDVLSDHANCCREFKDTSCQTSLDIICGASQGIMLKDSSCQTPSSVIDGFCQTLSSLEEVSSQTLATGPVFSLNIIHD